MEALERGTSTPVAAVPAEDDACASCGTVNDHDAKFCKHCGQKL